MDGNGLIELGEMVRSVASIYKMIGQNQVIQKLTNRRKTPSQIEISERQISLTDLWINW